MIFIWAKNLLIFILRMFIPPQPLPQIPEIDENAPCPGCGHCNGRLTSVQKDNKLLVQHDCQVCRAQWWELPVLRETSTTGSTVTVAAKPAKE